eukprot:881891-Alexandrium_andersonii.AAC.1
MLSDSFDEPGRACQSDCLAESTAALLVPRMPKRCRIDHGCKPSAPKSEIANLVLRCLERHCVCAWG